MALADFTNSIITKDGFSGTFKKFDQSVQGSARALDKLGGMVSGGGLGMLFGATAGVAGAAAIGKMAWELGEVGQIAITTERSFNNLMRSVGISASIIDEYATAADGTIAKTDLMRMASVALAGTTGELSSEMARLLPTLIEGARAASALNPAMGDASFMLQSLVSGVKRGSPMLIDNTGIVLKLGEANEAMAQRVGKSVEQLSAQEKSLAILYATADAVPTLVNQVGDAMDETATSSARLKVSWQELREEFGKEIAPSVTGVQKGLTDLFSGLTAGLQDDRLTLARQELERLEAAYQTNVTSQDGFIAGLARAIYGEDAWHASLIRSANAVEEQKAKVRALEVELIGYENASEAARFTATNYGIAVQQAGEMSAASTAAIVGLANSMNIVKAQFGAARAAIASYNAELKTGRTYIGAVDVLSEGQYVAATRGRAIYEKGLQAQLQANIITQEQLDYKLAAYDRSVNDHIGTLRDATKANTDYGASIADVGSSYDDVKSKIGAALKPTFDLSGLTGGLLGGAGGDAFDEAYKRLAAVALRPEEMQLHAQDWASTFEQAGLTGLTPEEAQQRAKELVEAYSKGLDFSLIDREKIKDQVRQSIRAEEIYNTIVDEIYAEMGKDKKQLSDAGYKIGQQVNAGSMKAAREGARDIANAWADVLTPEIIRRLDARGRREGLAQ